jgi:hypothetical protein
MELVMSFVVVHRRAKTSFASFYISKEDKTNPGQFDHYLDNPVLRTSCPCHQQAVESAVALMSTANLKCANDEGKSGYQGIIAAERQRNPASKQKKRKIID